MQLSVTVTLRSFGDLYYRTLHITLYIARGCGDWKTATDEIVYRLTLCVLFFKHVPIDRPNWQ